MQALAREALTLLEGALALWPGTSVKLHYIEKLIQTNQAQNVDPPPALIIGMGRWLLLSFHTAMCSGSLCRQ